MSTNDGGDELDEIDRALQEEAVKEPEITTNLTAPGEPADPLCKTDSETAEVHNGELSSDSEQSSESDSGSSSEDDNSDGESDNDESDDSLENFINGGGQESDNDDSEIPRTRNEILEDQIPQLPADLVLNDSTPLEAIGTIKAAGDRSVVIIANNSARYRVLADGAVLVLKEPTKLPIGVLYETFGPVDKPFYVVRFREETEVEPFKQQIGATVYQVVSTSRYVRTDEFKSKGTDASNFNDEEVPIEEQEFSDDEQEMLAKMAKTKKRKKNKKTKKEAEPKKEVDGPPVKRPASAQFTFTNTPVPLAASVSTTNMPSAPASAPPSVLPSAPASMPASTPPSMMPPPSLGMTPEMMQQWYQFQQFQQYQLQQMWQQQQQQQQKASTPPPPPPY